MPNRVVTVALFFCLVSVASAGQTQDSDSQTLHQILIELHAIRDDMRVSETAQLLVVELQIQQGVVNRATEDADNARNKLSEIRSEQKKLAAQLERFEDNLGKVTNPDDQKEAKGAVEGLKSELAALETSERDSNTTLQDMQQRLQDAQNKLANIDSELSSALARLGPVPKDADQPR
jgi:chromosome segregation ATPase